MKQTIKEKSPCPTTKAPQKILAALIFMLVAFGQFFAPHRAWSQGPCQAITFSATGSLAGVYFFPPNSHTGCTAGVPSGDAVQCRRTTAGTTYQNKFFASWPSTAARTMDATGGCIFMCASGDCRVGNDGLPVELLQFGVE